VTALPLADGAPDILLVCTGNQCRSPMAAALLGAELARRGIPLTVGSAGMVTDGVPPPRHAVKVMEARGLDISTHLSRRADEALIGSSGLVLGMTRQHVIDLATLVPDAWDRVFTVAEVLRRAYAAGPRRPEESIADYARRLSAGRRRSDVFQLAGSDDVPDPLGARRRDFERVGDRLAEWASALAPLLANT
jgi:protein-tyrosine-phosphatase